MPRAVPAYKISSSHHREGFFGLSKIGIAMIVAVIIYFAQASSDTYDTLQKNQPILEQQAKICMGEYSSKSCDPFSNSKECSELMECIQRGNGMAGVSWKTASITAFQEMEEGLPYIAITLILLLVCQLKMTLEDTAQRKDE